MQIGALATHSNLAGIWQVVTKLNHFLLTFMGIGIISLLSVSHRFLQIQGTSKW